MNTNTARLETNIAMALAWIVSRPNSALIASSLTGSFFRAAGSCSGIEHADDEFHLGFGEIAGDFAGIGDLALDRGGRLERAVEHDAQLTAQAVFRGQILAGQLAEFIRARPN